MSLADSIRVGILVMFLILGAFLFASVRPTWEDIRVRTVDIETNTRATRHSTANAPELLDCIDSRLRALNQKVGDWTYRVDTDYAKVVGEVEALNPAYLRWAYIQRDIPAGRLMGDLSDYGENGWKAISLTARGETDPDCMDDWDIPQYPGDESCLYYTVLFEKVYRDIGDTSVADPGYLPLSYVAIGVSSSIK